MADARGVSPILPRTPNAARVRILRPPVLRNLAIGQRAQLTAERRRLEENASKRKDRPNPRPPHRGSMCRPTDPVFTNTLGKPIIASNLRRTWRALRDHLELPAGIRMYDLRHEHASVLCAAAVHPKFVQERLGHSSIRVTLDTYTHLMPGMQSEAVTLIAAMLAPPTVPPKEAEGALPK